METQTLTHSPILTDKVLPQANVVIVVGLDSKISIKKCSVEGCENKSWGLSFCNKHYIRFKKYGDPNFIKLPHRGKGICSVAGCGKSHSARGFCFNHYMSWKGTAEGTNGNKCLVENCNRINYAKGFCRKHYVMNKERGTTGYKYPHVENCMIDGCLGKNYHRGYCSLHYHRFLNGISLDQPKYFHMRGANNPSWNGGVSEYPNHYLMKKIRLKVLQKANYICAECGGIADRIHHKDRSKDNHSEENFEPICCKCHTKFNKKSTSKFRRLYGKTLKEIGLEIGCSECHVRDLWIRDKLAYPLLVYEPNYEI